MFKRFLKYFTIIEWVMWLASVIIITVGFAVTKERSVLSYLSSLAGVTCIIINAKGNVIGQFISIAFGALYGGYAYTQHYYGEMIIYFALMIPIHIVSIYTWLKNKYNGNAHEVKINTLKKWEYAATFGGAVVVTAAFYFLLRALKTDNLIVSTISLTTSITAAYLMLRRCEYFSLCFIANDIILIVLWSMKLPSAGLQVLPSIMCFSAFLVIDLYSFFSWRKIRKRQSLPEGVQPAAQAEQPDGAEQTEQPAVENQNETPDD